MPPAAISAAQTQQQPFPSPVGSMHWVVPSGGLPDASMLAGVHSAGMGSAALCLPLIMSYQCIRIDFRDRVNMT